VNVLSFLTLLLMKWSESEWLGKSITQWTRLKEERKTIAILGCNYPELVYRQISSFPV
jgi:hypothetical protein